MLLLVVGDTHGEYARLKKEVTSLPAIDLLLHTGDHYRDGVSLARELGIECQAVFGNCDLGDGNRELLLELEGHRLLLTHGHLHNVKRTLNNLYYRALELSCDITIFGHTHVPFLEEVQGVWIMNPGSPTFPRGTDPPAFGLIELVPEKAALRIVEMGRG